MLGTCRGLESVLITANRIGCLWMLGESILTTAKCVGLVANTKRVGCLWKVGVCFTFVKLVADLWKIGARFDYRKACGMFPEVWRVRFHLSKDACRISVKTCKRIVDVLKVLSDSRNIFEERVEC